MATLYGMPAVEVVSPTGEIEPYLVKPASSSSWIVTKADGSEYRVHRLLFSRWRCTCKSAAYRRECKHIRAIMKHLEQNQ